MALRYAGGMVSCLLLAAATGCIVGGVQHAGTEHRTPTQRTPSCDPTGIEALEPRRGDIWRVTVARKVVVADGRVIRVEVPWNEPSEVRGGWLGPPRINDADVLRQLPAKVRDSLPTSRSPGLDELTDFMSRQALKDGTFVGYAVVTPASVPISLTCPDDGLLDGGLDYWTDARFGVVECGRPLSVNAPTGSGYARAKWC